MVERGPEGHVAGHKSLEAGCGVGRTVKDSQGPDCGEVDGGVAGDEGGEGRVEEEVFTLIAGPEGWSRWQKPPNCRTKSRHEMAEATGD